MTASETTPDVQLEFEASSRDMAILVRVGRGGQSLEVQLGDDALRLPDAELASRIIRLNTLAYLRSQLALREEIEERGHHVTSDLPTREQISAFEKTITF